MTRAFLFGLLVLATAGCSLFTTPQQRAERREAREARHATQPPPLLWEVTGDAGTMFLLGTMHFGVELDDLPPVVTEALQSCDTFVLESDPSTADQRQLADMMVLERGTPGLDERLGPERWSKLLVLLDGMFEERVAARLRPWVIEAAVIRELLPRDEPMESTLIAVAKGHGLPINYLETWQTQIKMLNRVTRATALAAIVDDPDGFRERTQRMSTDYIRGDLVALERHVFGEHYASADELFEDRNRSWMPRLDELARSNRAFVAVGAGHLLGPHSILQMLEERGYELRRVTELKIRD